MSLLAQATSGDCSSTNGVSQGCLDTFNDILLPEQAKQAQFATPRGIISELLPYAFVIAGLILFVMLLWGGFEMLTGAADTKSQEAGKQRITNAIIGFALLFVSYWLAKILEIVFGISVL